MEGSEHLLEQILSQERRHGFCCIDPPPHGSGPSLQQIWAEGNVLQSLRHRRVLNNANALRLQKYGSVLVQQTQQHLNRIPTAPVPRLVRPAKVASTTANWTKPAYLGPSTLSL